MYSTGATGRGVPPRAALRDWQVTIAAARLCNRRLACQNAGQPE